MPPGADLWSLQAFLMIAGLALALFAAARPQWGKTNEKIIERSRNVVVAIDVSRSMLAEDVRPNRLERVKADVADLIDSLEGDRCALVAFRASGTLICPLTTDHGFLRSALEQMTPDSAPRGETDLGGAIRASLTALDPAADDHNAVIIISDGGDLRGEAIQNAEIARKRGIPVFTVGIGDPRVGATIPSEDGRGPMKFKGETVKVKLEESALKAIAQASSGRYVPLATAGTAETTLGAIYRRFLRQVAAKEQNEEENRTAERYHFFLVPALALIIAGASLSKGRFAAVKRVSR
jgi:Ca-activated chloride channel family protein